MHHDETLRRFVLRARRVEAHSLVQNQSELLRQASGQFKISLDVNGLTTIIRPLPGNEEVFESLATRIRPLTVKSEPVYYAKVFDALSRVLEDMVSPKQLQTQLDALRRAWEAAEIQGTQTQGYSVQATRMDGSETTNPVSDTQLAAAWLYADLVHADAQGPKKEALAFSIHERYAAAVRVFSNMAVLTVATLRLIESLQNAGALSIVATAWAEEVVVGASELTQEGTAFFAPLGTAMPDMRDTLQLSEDWNALTATEVLKLNPANHVLVKMLDDAGEVTASHEAVVSRRSVTEEAAEWDVLVTGSTLFKFTFDFKGDNSLFRGWDTLESTNELKLASTLILLQVFGAAKVVFEVHGQPFVALNAPDLPEEERNALEVDLQTLDDIVTIERLSGKTLDPCHDGYNDCDRVRLRWARLLREGHIIYTRRGPVPATAQANPPQLLAVAPREIEVGGTKVPTMHSYMRHPRMTFTELDSAPAGGPETRSYRITPPDGERFFEWCPALVSVAADDELVVTAQWGLHGISEETFPF